MPFACQWNCVIYIYNAFNYGFAVNAVCLNMIFFEKDNIFGDENIGCLFFFKKTIMHLMFGGFILHVKQLILIPVCDIVAHLQSRLMIKCLHQLRAEKIKGINRATMISLLRY